jgi:hypothetical protein
VTIRDALIVGAACLVLAGWPAAQARPRDPRGGVERYASASIDAAGNLVVTRADGKTTIVRKRGDQKSFGEPVVSPDGTAVGAQALFSNCCTSYDIPLQLVVYANGRVHRFKGIGLSIFRWHFASGGSRVAYGQEPVHFGCEIHYELREIVSERLLEAADIPQQCEQVPDPRPAVIPLWVEELRADRR